MLLITDGDCGMKAAVGFLRAMVGVQNAHPTEREHWLSVVPLPLFRFNITTEPFPLLLSMVNGLMSDVDIG